MSFARFAKALAGARISDIGGEAAAIAPIARRSVETEFFGGKEHVGARAPRPG